ncbi:MAG: SUF system NifU family Fe-S cluster assembly protein [Candidatus Micrarchaeota archaeon]
MKPKLNLTPKDVASLSSDNQLFSDIILELYKNPLNKGELKDATNSAELGNPSCGDKVKIFIKVKNGKISDASFVGQGCAISTASASVVTEMIKGKTVKDALALKPQKLFAELGGVIQTRIRCATLGLSTMKKALTIPNSKL